MDSFSIECYNLLMSNEHGEKFLISKGYNNIEDIQKLYRRTEESKNSTSNISTNKTVKTIVRFGEIIKCKKCNSTNIKEISAQTRSIDEGETQYIHCNDCNSTYT
jgi:DNA-directed RNA polymerase subunit M/transcription elongation factor TFIIS